MKYKIVGCLLFFPILASAAPLYHNPSEILAKAHQSKQVGREIYTHFCASCHEPDPLIPLGAPRKGNKQDWQARLKQRNLKAMLKTTDEGINNMPPRGGCFECTDDDLLAAIQYMLPHEKP